MLVVGGLHKDPSICLDGGILQTFSLNDLIPNTIFTGCCGGVSSAKCGEETDWRDVSQCCCPTTQRTPITDMYKSQRER